MAQYIGKEDEYFDGLEELCDAILKTEDGCSYKVHRVILSKYSSYFRALFLFDGCDKSNGDYSLPWFSGRTVEQILLYLYNGKILLEADNIVELLLASDYFLLDDLLLKCQSFAKEQLSLTNCVEIFAASHVNDRLGLYKSSRRFIRVNFSKLIDQPLNEIADIPLEVIKALLEDDSLNIPDETYIWRAVEKWVGSSPERLPAVQELLSTIRFPNHNTQFVQYLLRSNILRKNPYMKELNDILLTEESTDLSIVFKTVLSSKYPKTDFSRPRQPKKLYLITKSCCKENTAVTDLYVTYNEDVCMRRKITLRARNNFWPNQMAVVDHLAYMFDSWTGKAMIFNLLDKTWKEMQPMNRARRKYTIVHEGKFLYAIGGFVDTFDESETSCAFEMYDTKNQSWKHLGSTVNTVTAASLESKIYILGEYPSSSIMTAEEYDTVSGTFSEIPVPETSRTGFAMIVYDNQIFVIAGLGDNGQLNSVEVFSPETRIWKTFQHLPFGLEYPNAKIVDDKLIVFDDSANRPPVFWNKSEKVWKPFRSKCFKSIAKYLFHPIEHCDTITCLMKENSSYEQKWRTIEDDIF
ncbi:Kelch-like protein 10 [Araneus ventricosus]|uniref:Kelch-like protein diablo n=1 Tax=Araneus ventricosus TaxID=182803 RepID=A0A4Y2LLB2_ARAVE|nr:Kelch-like protein 10 [Araneus ventricosus]